MKSEPLRSWKIGHVCGWLRKENLSSLTGSFMRARVDGRMLVDLEFSKLQKLVSGDAKEIHELPSAYGRLMRRHKIAWRFTDEEMRGMETKGLPSAFRSSGSAAGCQELGPLKGLPDDARNLAKSETAISGERSQWDFEQDFMDPSDANADAMMDVPWDTFPLWRVGVELRRILSRANYGISVLTRLAMHYNEDIERIEVSRDLLPLPLPTLSDEDEVDRAIGDLEDEDFVSTSEALSLWWWLGTESWMFVIVALLNFLHTGKGSRMSDLGVSKDKMSKVQELAFMRLYTQVQHSITIPPYEDFQSSDHSWEKVLSSFNIGYAG